MIALLLLLAAEPAVATPAAAAPVEPAEPSLSLPAQEQLKQARATYEYGNYASAIHQLEQLTESHRLESLQDQIEAYRLLGLADFFFNHNDDARRAFLNLLSLDPDLQLDPLFVPPQAIAFFEQVRRDNQDALEPIRVRKRATQEAIKQEEEARRKLLAQVNGAPAQVIVERIDRPNVLIPLLPFGAGQFQNGNKPLGIGLAAVEGLALATSIGTFAWVMSQTASSPYCSPQSFCQTMYTVRTVQVATGAGFGALWLLGIGEAYWNLRAPIITREESTAGTGSPVKLSGASIAPIPGGGAGSLTLSF